MSINHVNMNDNSNINDNDNNNNNNSNTNNDNNKFNNHNNTSPKPLHCHCHGALDSRGQKRHHTPPEWLCPIRTTACAADVPLHGPACPLHAT